jgi:oxepin-CoA hydrolase/3-oxo-5,6-dehydrosuberyl-CoA semialdehyde dehydrogenase
MDAVKYDYVTRQFCALVKQLPADAAGKWGKMNGQQMVEHVAGFFKVSTNKLKFELVTPAEHLPNMMAFLYSDKAFRENTKAPVLPDEPLPLRHASITDAINELQQEVDAFVQLFTQNPGLKTTHPVFGALNFEEWILLHYKHVLHHARQFGLA